MGIFPPTLQRIQHRSFPSASGRADGFEGSLKTLNQFEQRTTRTQCSCFILNKSICGAIMVSGTDPRRLLNCSIMLSQADVSSQRSWRHRHRRHNLCCEGSSLALSSVFLIFEWKTVWLCRTSLLLFCGCSARITRNVIMLFDYSDLEFTASGALQTCFDCILGFFSGNFKSHGVKASIKHILQPIITWHRQQHWNNTY